MTISRTCWESATQGKQLKFCKPDQGVPLPWKPGPGSSGKRLPLTSLSDGGDNRSSRAGSLLQAYLRLYSVGLSQKVGFGVVTPLTKLWDEDVNRWDA
jgi:hypothetical protein